MRTVDRGGVHLEQCDGCRGIFLDRGELEQIVGAEQRHYAQPAQAYRADSPAPFRGGGHGGYADSPRPHRGYQDSPRPYGGGHGGYSDSPRPYGHGGHKKRKRGFLEELFD